MAWTARRNWLLLVAAILLAACLACLALLYQGRNVPLHAIYDRVQIGMSLDEVLRLDQLKSCDCAMPITAEGPGLELVPTGAGDQGIVSIQFASDRTVLRKEYCSGIMLKMRRWFDRLSRILHR